jgi:acetoacetyl-CoA synthetase
MTHSGKASLPGHHPRAYQGSAVGAPCVPTDAIRVDAIPRMLSGKKMELPITKFLMGQPAEKVANPDTMANSGSLAWFAAFARDRAASDRGNRH